MLPSLRKFICANLDVMKLQDNVQLVWKTISNKVLVDGVLVTNVTVGTDLTMVPHKLGRAPQGYVVVRKRAQADIWDEQDNNVNALVYLALKSSAPVEIDLWVF